MSALRKDRRPWPMKWIVLTIIVVLVPYTFLTLYYRKPGPAYRPYQDAQERANVVRLLSAGYQRITVAAQRPADSPRAAAAAPTTAVLGGLPSELVATLVQKPLLPPEIHAVTAAPSVSALQPYAIQFTCTLPDNKQQLAGASLYIRDDEIIIARYGSMPAVKFPHRQHTLWLDCSNCHDQLFKAERGANRFSMAAILNGEQCGLCHGAVAFPLTECLRCHSVSNASLRRAAAP